MKSGLEHWYAGHVIHHQDAKANFTGQIRRARGTTYESMGSHLMSQWVPISAVVRRHPRLQAYGSALQDERNHRFPTRVLSGDLKPMPVVIARTNW